MSVRITRVKSLAIKKFRGFTGPECTLDTDADIVLITGPNGVGKTSFIDALCLSLTGHHYPEREPLLPYDERKGSIIAKVVLSSGEEREIRTVIERRGQEFIDWGGVLIAEGDPKALAPFRARAAFYFQDTLKYLFEEESGQAYLEDFLIASQVPVSNIKKALRSAYQDLKQFREELQKNTAVKSEGEITKERTALARRFEELIRSLSAQTSTFLGPAQATVPACVLTKKEGDLRQDWKKVLHRWLGDLMSYLGDEQDKAVLPPEADNEALLKRIHSTLSGILTRAEEEQRKGLSSRQKIENILSTSQDGELFLTEQAISRAEAELERLVKKRDDLAGQKARTEKLLRRYAARADGTPGLMEVFAAIRMAGHDWLDTSESDGICPPRDVLKWVEQSLEGLDLAKPAVDVQFEEWYQRVNDVRMNLGEELSRIEAEIPRFHRRIQLSKEFIGSVHNIPEFQGKLAELVQVYGEQPVSVALLRQALGFKLGTPGTSDQVQSLQKLLSVVEEWVALERVAVDAETARQKEHAYQSQRRRVEELIRILELETDEKKSSIRFAELAGPEKRVAFGRAVDFVLGRLQPLPQMKMGPVEVGQARKAWTFKTGDGRSLRCLSTGQKSILAIACTIALNAALRKTLLADVIAFDDFTSSLDLNQIPRLATLLRQIAYGSGIGQVKDPFRKQLFLVSHHEDLTNRLLDFLIPPQGRSMRILNFRSWSRDNGPSVEVLDVVPAKSALDLDDMFAAALKDALTRFAKGM